MAHFFLTDEPWIPCETATGGRVALGLRQVLAQAHELRAISDGSPLVTAGLHRLVLAIVQRCFGPPTLGDWLGLYRAGRFDGRLTSEYLAEWRSRFDLFDEERPFYQATGMEFERKPAHQLVAERSNFGASMPLLQHRPAADRSGLPAAAAARALVSLQAFAPGGLVARGKGDKPSAMAAPLNRSAMVLVKGTTLFETLVLNAVEYVPGKRPVAAASGRDLPAWEHREAPRAEERTTRGWLDLLTWQSRRVHLWPDHTGNTVEQVVVAGGWDLDAPGLHDPMVAYQRDPKRGELPIGLSEQRAVWRDAHVLLRAAAADDAHQPAKACLQLADGEIVRHVAADRVFSLEVYGLVPDQAKILMSRTESLPFSPRLLTDERLGEHIVQALADAEAAGDRLRAAAWSAARHALSVGERSPDAKDVRNLVDATGTVRRYWARLQTPFYSFIGALTHGDAAAIERFRPVVRETALWALAAGSEALGDSARALKGQSVAEAHLRRGLRDLRSQKEA